MHRSLSPIGENDHLTSSFEARSYEDLPTVTPMLRTFEETTQRQNAENAKLRKQFLAYQEKEAQLSDRVQELEELTTALTSNTGRNSTNKTENTASTYTPKVAIPSSPLGLTPRVPRPQDDRWGAERLQPNIFRYIGTMVHYFPYVFPASKPNIWTEAEAEPEA